MTESPIVKAILDAYEGHPRITLWRQNTGAMRRGGRLVRFGRRGCADITGVMEGGRRIEIECKKLGNRTDKKRMEEQAEFGEMIRKRGGLYLVAYSVDDVVALLG